MPMITVISAIVSPDPVLPRAIDQPPQFSDLRDPGPDPLVLAMIRRGSGPVSRWDLIDALEPDLGGPRDELRRRRSTLLRRLDDLVRSGVLKRHGRRHVRLPSSLTVGLPGGEHGLSCRSTVASSQ